MDKFEPIYQPGQVVVVCVKGIDERPGRIRSWRLFQGKVQYDVHTRGLYGRRIAGGKLWLREDEIYCPTN